MLSREAQGVVDCACQQKRGSPCGKQAQVRRTWMQLGASRSMSHFTCGACAGKGANLAMCPGGMGVKPWSAGLHAYAGSDRQGTEQQLPSACRACNNLH